MKLEDTLSRMDANGAIIKESTEISVVNKGDALKSFMYDVRLNQLLPQRTLLKLRNSRRKLLILRITLSKNGNPQIFV